MLVPAVLFAAYAAQTHARALADAEETVRRRAAVLAEHVARVFDTHAMLLDFIEAKLERRSFGDIGSAADVTRLLHDKARLSTIVTALVVLDDRGTVIAANLDKARGLSAANRDYFTGPGEGSALHVGEQIVGRVSDKPIFSLSRRRAGGGVIAAMLGVEYFTQVFESLTGPPEGGDLVALFRADGKQLARLPRVAKPVQLRPNLGLMARMPHEVEGVYRGVPMLSDGEVLFGFHKVPGYPVWVTNGLDVSTVTEAWLRGLVPQALLSLVAAALLAVASGWILRRERKSEAANARLELAVAQRTAEAEQRAAEATEAAQAREAALAAAHRAHAAKSHFLASASHDLRQPIQGLRLFLDVLDHRLTEGEERRILGLAGKALEGAEELLSTLLDVSTLEAGMVTAHPRAVALAPLIGGLASEFAPQAAACGLRLRAVPTSLWGATDPVLLARVLRNLLTNALRYTASGGVLLGCRRRGAMVMVEVCDTGPGIPADKLDLVFEDFVQLGNPERDRTKGLGLGLAVARRMAALLGHELGVRSLPGRGTVFWIAVPLAAADGAPNPTPAETTPLSV